MWKSILVTPISLRVQTKKEEDNGIQQTGSTQEVMEGDLSLTDLGLQSKLSRLE